MNCVCVRPSQLTDDVKKEKEKEPEKEPAPALMRKKGFEEEKKDSDDSDDVSIHLSSKFSPFLSLDEKNTSQTGVFTCCVVPILYPNAISSVHLFTSLRGGKVNDWDTDIVSSSSALSVEVLTLEVVLVVIPCVCVCVCAGDQTRCSQDV